MAIEDGDHDDREAHDSERTFVCSVIAVVSTLLTGAVLLGVLVSLFFRQRNVQRSANAA